MFGRVRLPWRAKELVVPLLTIVPPSLLLCKASVALMINESLSRSSSFASAMASRC